MGYIIRRRPVPLHPSVARLSERAEAQNDLFPRRLARHLATGNGADGVYDWAPVGRAHLESPLIDHVDE